MYMILLFLYEYRSMVPVRHRDTSKLTHNHINCNRQQNLPKSRTNLPKAGQTDINDENIVFLYLFAGSQPDQ